MENFLAFAQEQFVVVTCFVAAIILFIRFEASKGGIKLSPQQLTQAVNAGSAVLLDVRDSKEYDAGHIVDAINIPHAKVSGSLKQLEKYRQKQIIVVDKLGQNSGPVVKTLVAEGFNAVRLGGGIGEWQQQTLPLVK